MEPHEHLRAFSAVFELVNQAELAAQQVADPLVELVQAVEAAMQGSADPYVLLGVLVEGIAQTIGRLPQCRQSIALLATLTMLHERNDANAATGDEPD